MLATTSFITGFSIGFHSREGKFRHSREIATACRGHDCLPSPPRSGFEWIFMIWILRRGYVTTEFLFHSAPWYDHLLSHLQPCECFLWMGDKCIALTLLCPVVWKPRQKMLIHIKFYRMCRNMPRDLSGQFFSRKKQNKKQQPGRVRATLVGREFRGRDKPIYQKTCRRYLDHDVWPLVIEE